MELTNTLQAALKQRNLNLLAAKINENGGNLQIGDLQGIIENLSLLAEKGESFGEESRFIRLDVLRLLGALNETGRLVFKLLPETIKWSNDNTVVSLGGYLVEVRPDGSEVTVSGFAAGGASLEEVYSSEVMSDSRRMASMMSLASARAEKSAYQNAGIGIEYKKDVFDLEASEAMLPAPKPVLPTPVSQDEKKARRKAAKAKKDAEKPVAEVSAPAAEVAEPEPEPVQETIELEKLVNVPEPAKGEAVETEVVFATNAETSETTPAPSPEAAGEMTFDQALSTVVDAGANKGKPFSEIVKNKASWRVFIWLKKNLPDGGRDAGTAKAIDVVCNTLASQDANFARVYANS